MKFLNSQQLAFILDIKDSDAREKMVLAHCKSKDIDPPKRRKRSDFEEPKTAQEKKKLREYLAYSEYPIALSVDLLAEKLNLPTLQFMVDDIQANYLKRPAVKKWILCDYPEKQLEKVQMSGQIKSISIPPALKSLLPKETKDAIHSEWKIRFPKAKIKV